MHQRRFSRPTSPRRRFRTNRVAGSSLQLKVLEERRLLSATSNDPTAEPLSLTGQGELSLVTGTLSSSMPEITNFSSGGFAITWNGDSLKRFDSAGVALGPAVSLQYADGDIAVNSSGNSVAVESSSAVLVNRYDPSGARIGDLIIVNLSSAPGTAPQVEMDESGNFAVIWKGSPDNADAIFVRLYDAAGNPRGDKFIIGETTGSFDAAMNDAGDMVVGFGATSVNAVVVKASGQVMGKVQVPSATGFQSVAINEFGDFSLRYGAGGRFIQRFDASGKSIGSPIDIGTSLSSVDMAMETGGELIVTGHRSGTGYEVGGSGNAVLARRYDASGSPLENWFVVNSTVSGDQQFPSVAAVSGAEFIVAWESQGSPDAINAQRFIDDALPTVEETTPSWGTAISSGSTLISQLPELRVAFSRPMNVAEVTSLANWQLLDDGLDVSSLISSISYENGAAILSFSQPLRGAGYQLIASDAIHDTLARALDGDNNSIAGGAYTIDFSIQQDIVGLGPEILVDSGESTLTVPSVSINSQGGFAVGYGFSGVSTVSYAQVFNPSGVSFSAPYVVNSQSLFDMQWIEGDEYAALSGQIWANSLYSLGSTGVQASVPITGVVSLQTYFTEIATNGPNTIFVGTDNHGTPTAPDEDVIAARVFADGTMGPIIPVNTTLLGFQGAAAIAMAASGDFVVTWSSVDQDGDGYGIFARRFAADGTPLGDEFQVNSYTAGYQVFSTIAMAPDGKFTIGWISLGQEGSDGIYIQRYAADGTPLGGETRVSAVGPTAAGMKIAMDDAGRTLVVWLQDDTALMGRVIASDGSLPGDPFLINTLPIDISQVDPIADVSMNSVGDAVVAWTTFHDVHVQRLSFDHPPVVDLNGADAGLDFATDVQLDGNPVPIVDGDLFVSDAPVENLVGASITIVGQQAGDLLAVDTTGTNIVASYSAGVLSLSGADTVAHFEQVLRTATFATTASRAASSIVDIQFVVDDGLSVSSVATSQVGIYVPGSAMVAHELLLYANSVFDSGPPAYIDPALAIFKNAYHAGDGLATFANVSSYSRGINSIAVDLMFDHGTPTLDDFTFRVGTNNDPNSWVDAPAPISFEIYTDLGPDGQDRIEIIWADGAIKNTWLEVTLAANSRTGLAQPDVFYYGNRIGDSGTGTGAEYFSTTTTDSLQVFATLGTNKPVNDLRDYNRDGQVNTTDSQIVFANLGNLIRLDLPGPVQNLVAAPALAVASLASRVNASTAASTSQAVAFALVAVTDEIEAAALAPIAMPYNHEQASEGKIVRSRICEIQELADESLAIDETFSLELGPTTGIQRKLLPNL